MTNIRHSGFVILSSLGISEFVILWRFAQRQILPKPGPVGERWQTLTNGVAVWDFGIMRVLFDPPSFGGDIADRLSDCARKFPLGIPKLP